MSSFTTSQSTDLFQKKWLFFIIFLISFSASAQNKNSVKQRFFHIEKEEETTIDTGKMISSIERIEQTLERTQRESEITWRLRSDKESSNKTTSILRTFHTVLDGSAPIDFRNLSLYKNIIQEIRKQDNEFKFTILEDEKKLDSLKKKSGKNSFRFYDSTIGPTICAR